MTFLEFLSKTDGERLAWLCIFTIVLLAIITDSIVKIVNKRRKN